MKRKYFPAVSVCDIYILTLCILITEKIEASFLIIVLSMGFLYHFLNCDLTLLISYNWILKIFSVFLSGHLFLCDILYFSISGHQRLNEMSRFLLSYMRFQSYILFQFCVQRFMSNASSSRFPFVSSWTGSRIADFCSLIHHPVACTYWEYNKRSYHS